MRATVIGTAAGVASLIVALIAWQWPQSAPEPGPGPTAAAGATTTGSAPPSVSAAPPASPTGSLFLAGTAPESGAAYLKPLPRAIRADDGYRSQPLVVTCPSNQSGDQRHDVTYQLHGRYADLTANVHPYYPAGTDQAAVARVTLTTETRQTDGTLLKDDAVTVGTAKPGDPRPLTAQIDGAEKITVRVECDNPSGLVVLTDARVS